MAGPLLIGVSSRIHHPTEPARALGGVYTKTLHYLEQSVAHWIISRNVLVLMIPAVESEGLVKRSEMRLYHYAEALDGLVLQGGADIAPPTYGERAENPEWSGDPVRDRYEIELLEAFNHRDIAKYEQNYHQLRFVPDSRLARLYPGHVEATINTIHHQAVKKLGRGLLVEAMSVPDNVVEAIRWRGPSYVLGVQWHPEFMWEPKEGHLDGTPILNEFLEAARARKAQAK
jgi:putative glutamine amidotransferase